MSRITGVTLLLVILAVSFYHSTASHAETEFHRFKVPIRQCRCTVFARGKKNCPKPLLPANSSQIQALANCLCSKPEHHMFKTACGWYRQFIQSRQVKQSPRPVIPSTPL